MAELSFKMSHEDRPFNCNIVVQYHVYSIMYILIIYTPSTFSCCVTTQQFCFNSFGFFSLFQISRHLV